MARLLAAGRALVAHRDLEDLLAQILEAAREITAARYAAIGVLDRHGRQLERFITSGLTSEQELAIGDPPRGRGILGVLISDPAPLRLDRLSDHPAAVGFPPHHPPMAGFLGLPIQVRGHAWGNIYLTDKAGGPFDADDQLALTVLSEWAAVAIESAALYQGLTERSGQLERLGQALRTSSQVARSISGEGELAPVLGMIATCVRSLLGTADVAIALERSGELEVVAQAGEGPDHPAAAALQAHAVARRAMAGQACARTVGGAVLAPLRFRGQPLGVLSAQPGPSEPIGPSQEEYLISFAATAATAVATARSADLERLRQAIEAADAERGRWARELHDETLQGLGGLRVLLTTALRTAGPAQLRGAVQAAVDQLATEADTLRLLITELRPAALDELGLEPAIESLIARVRALEGLDIETHLNLDAGDPRLDPEFETAAYRLVQEALTNVSKHAGADRVRVRVWRDHRALQIEVSDNGVGFDPAHTHQGFGITGMRERVHLAGGSLTITSAPGQGTTVSARLPTADQGNAR